MPPAAPASRVCPNCSTLLPVGSRQCPGCKLEVARMPAFAAAKRAAQQRGIQATRVEKKRHFHIPISPKMVMLVVFLALLGAGGWWLFGPKPPRYLQFPGTAQAAVQSLLTHISAGTDPEYLKAYDLIADSARNRRASDEKGDYQQLFHGINGYLAGEFGAGWADTAKIVPDPADPTVMVATVGVETLHIHTAQQTPPDRMTPYGPHYGITGIDEFDILYAADLRKFAVIEDIVGGFVGQGSLNDLKTVLGAGGPNPHWPKMLRKISMLATLRNPHAATARSTLQIWVYRDDPVVRRRLDLVQNDPRYDPRVIEVAKEILANKVPEEELDAVGISH
jgi:hypothetical protein